MNMDTTTTADVVETGTAAPEPSDRDRAIAAAEALINAPGEGVDTEKSVVPSEAPTKPELPDSENDSKTAKLAVIARAKRQAAEIREKAQADAGAYARERDEARARAEQAEARFKQLAPLQDAMALSQTDPMGFLRKLGLDPRQFFSKALEKPQELDPVQSVERKLAAKYEDLEKLVRGDIESRQEREKQAEADREAQRVNQISTQFIDHVKENASKFPTVSVLYEDDYSALVAKADRVGIEYHADTGKHASWDDILEFIEFKESERVAKVTNPKEQSGSKGSPPAVRAKGKPPISTSGAGSSKQTTQKRFSDMSPSEQRDHAIAEAEKAIQAAKIG